MRKTYDKAFKAKIALEAIRGEKTIQEIANAYCIHPNLIGQRKARLLENTASIFEKQGKGSAEEAEAERTQDELYRQAGKLQVENDFLKKSTGTYTGASRYCRTGVQGTDHSRTMLAVGNQPVSLLLSTEGKGG